MTVHSILKCPFFAASQMVSLYYALSTEKESDCQKFNMSVELIPGNLPPLVSCCLFVIICHHLSVCLLLCACFVFPNCILRVQHSVKYFSLMTKDFMLMRYVASAEKMDDEEKIYKLRIQVL